MITQLRKNIEIDITTDEMDQGKNLVQKESITM